MNYRRYCEVVSRHYRNAGATALSSVGGSSRRYRWLRATLAYPKTFASPSLSSCERLRYRYVNTWARDFFSESREGGEGKWVNLISPFITLPSCARNSPRSVGAFLSVRGARALGENRFCKTLFRTITYVYGEKFAPWQRYTGRLLSQYYFISFFLL